MAIRTGSRVYRGERLDDGGTRVTADGAELDSRTDIVNHGRGFAWGYHGSGPAQLALAVLRDHLDHAPVCAALMAERAGVDLGDRGARDALAERHHQDLKRKYFALLPQEDDWELDGARLSELLEEITTAQERRT